MLIIYRQPRLWLLASLLTLYLVPFSTLGAESLSTTASKVSKSSSQAPKPSSTWIEVPATTGMVILVDFRNQLTFLDKKGKPVARCQLCTLELEKKLGPDCKEAEQYQINICRSTTRATKRDENLISIGLTSASPQCISAHSNGFYGEQCLTKEECELLKPYISGLEC